MTNCEHYQKLISRMLDNDLSKDERSALAAHVKTCPDCAAVYVAFRSLSEHLGADLEEVPPSVHENVMAEVRRDSLRAKNSVHRSHRRWHTALTVAACLVLVAAAGLSLPRLAPRMGKSAAPQAAEPFAMAEDPMTEEAAPEERESAYEGMTKNDALRTADSTLDEAPAEAPLPNSQAVTQREDGTVVLDEEKSLELLNMLSREQTTLSERPKQEIRLIYTQNGAQNPMTLLLTEREAVCVFADGDSYFRIDASPEEMLSFLGLNE